jgi:hypothetical protein
MINRHLATARRAERRTTTAPRNVTQAARQSAAPAEKSLYGHRMSEAHASGDVVADKQLPAGVRADAVQRGEAGLASDYVLRRA